MFKKFVCNTVVVILILLFSDVFVNAHSGRTDRYGGHNDRKNGGYHYHNSGTVRRQSVTRTNTTNKAIAGRVKVRGYYRKDGTYVRPHYRTAPDGNPRNNYSFPGNYNPNTGKITPGDPQKYLDRYYNKSGNSSSPVNVDQTLTQIPKVTPPVVQDTSKPDIQTNLDPNNWLQKQEMDRMIRNMNRPPGSDLPDEITMVFGFLIIIAFIYGFITMIYDSLKSR